MFYIVYGYNIWVVAMVQVNGETSYSWAEKAEIYNDSYSGGGRYVGFQSEGIGNQQERVNRTHSEELPCFITRRESVNPRTATSGGTVTQLIQDTERQLAEFESHALKLRTHLQKLYILRSQLGEE